MPWSKEVVRNSGRISIEPRLVVNGTLNGVAVTVLLDDGCVTNIISTRLVEANQKCFNTQDVEFTIFHSLRGCVEKVSEAVLNGALYIGPHSYTSNWAVADSSVDVILGMPWRVANNPDIDYVERSVGLESVDTPPGEDQGQGEEEKPEVKAPESSATNFSRILKSYSKKKKLQKLQKRGQIRLFSKSVQYHWKP